MCFFDSINPKCSLEEFPCYKNDYKYDKTNNSRKTSISDYLRCKKNLSVSVYASYKSVVNELKECDVKSIYQTCLEKIKKVVSDWVTNDTTELKKVVRAILYIIQNDDTIDGESEFYIDGMNTPVKKEELSDNFSNKPVRISFPEFLLGVWIFIIRKGINNKDGLVTYNYLFPSNGDVKNVPREYQGILNGKYTREIEIVCENQGDQEIPEKQEVSEKQEVPEKNDHQTNEVADENTAVITKELEYRCCFYCEKWSGSLEDGRKGRMGMCLLQKGPKKTNGRSLRSFFT